MCIDRQLTFKLYITVSFNICKLNLNKFPTWFETNNFKPRDAPLLRKFIPVIDKACRVGIGPHVCGIT